MSIRGMPLSVCCCAHMSSVVCAAGSRSKRYFRQAWGSISLALAISNKDNSMALRVSTLGGSGEEPVFSYLITGYRQKLGSRPHFLPDIPAQFE